MLIKLTNATLATNCILLDIGTLYAVRVTIVNKGIA
jgi:hypothetical protein